MVLVCHVISQDHMIKGSYDFMGGSPLIHHPAKFGGHRHCVSGDMMFVVAEGQETICPRLDLPF